MKFDDVQKIVGGVPFISARNGRFLYDLIVREKLTNLLELGIAHGTATCYMAAALHENGGGTLTAVDLHETANTFHPSAEEQLAATGLSELVDVVRMKTGYSWFLHDAIANNTRDGVCREIYDLCIVDGPKNWTIDGGAFFFADKLLKKDGWLIFDDYSWTYDSASKRRDATDGITHRDLSADERAIPHIREVFELLVKQHPHYCDFLLLEDDDWAIAKKSKSADKSYRIVYQETSRDLLAKVIRRVQRRLSRTRRYEGERG